MLIKPYKIIKPQNTSYGSFDAIPHTNRSHDYDACQLQPPIDNNLTTSKNKNKAFEELR